MKANILDIFFVSEFYGHLEWVPQPDPYEDLQSPWLLTTLQSPWLYDLFLPHLFGVIVYCFWVENGSDAGRPGTCQMVKQ